MDTAPLKEIVNELLSSLENLEAQSTAVLEFLKTEKRGADKKLAPFLEQAAEASNVRFRAARLRMERLFSEIERQEEKAAQQSKEAEQAAQPKPEKQTEAADGSEKSSVTDRKKVAPTPPHAAEEAAPKVQPIEKSAKQADQRPGKEAKPSPQALEESDQPKSSPSNSSEPTRKDAA